MNTLGPRDKIERNVGDKDLVTNRAPLELLLQLVVVLFPTT